MSDERNIENLVIFAECEQSEAMEAYYHCGKDFDDALDLLVETKQRLREEEAKRKQDKKDELERLEREKLKRLAEEENTRKKYEAGLEQETHRSGHTSKKVFQRTGEVIPAWFQANHRNVKLHVRKNNAGKVNVNDSVSLSPLEKRQLRHGVTEIQRFSESIFYSLKAQRVDAKIACGEYRGNSGRVRRIAPREKARRKKSLNLAMQKIARLSHLEDVALSIRNEWTENIFGCQKARLYIYHKAENILTGEAVRSDNRLLHPAGEGLIGQVVSKGKTINVANAQHDKRFGNSSDKLTTSFLCTRIENTFGQPLGVVALYNKDSGARFDQEDENILEKLTTSLGHHFSR